MKKNIIDFSIWTEDESYEIFQNEMDNFFKIEDSEVNNQNYNSDNFENRNFALIGKFGSGKSFFKDEIKIRNEKKYDWIDINALDIVSKNNDGVENFKEQFVDAIRSKKNKTKKTYWMLDKKSWLWSNWITSIIGIISFTLSLKCLNIPKQYLWCVILLIIAILFATPYLIYFFAFKKESKFIEDSKKELKKLLKGKKSIICIDELNRIEIQKQKQIIKELSYLNAGEKKFLIIFVGSEELNNDSEDKEFMQKFIGKVFLKVVDENTIEKIFSYYNNLEFSSLFIDNKRLIKDFTYITQNYRNLIELLDYLSDFISWTSSGDVLLDNFDLPLIFELMILKAYDLNLYYKFLVLLNTGFRGNFDILYKIYCSGISAFFKTIYGEFDFKDVEKKFNKKIKDGPIHEKGVYSKYIFNNFEEYARFKYYGEFNDPKLSTFDNSHNNLSTRIFTSNKVINLENKIFYGLLLKEEKAIVNKEEKTKDNNIFLNGSNLAGNCLDFLNEWDSASNLNFYKEINKIKETFLFYNNLWNDLDYKMIIIYYNFYFMKNYVKDNLDYDEFKEKWFINKNGRMFQNILKEIQILNTKLTDVDKFCFENLIKLNFFLNIFGSQKENRGPRTGNLYDIFEKSNVKLGKNDHKEIRDCFAELDKITGKIGYFSRIKKRELMSWDFIKEHFLNEENLKFKDLQLIANGDFMSTNMDWLIQKIYSFIGSEEEVVKFKYKLSELSKDEIKILSTRLSSYEKVPHIEELIKILRFSN